VVTDEHLQHMVAMETNEPDSAAEVDEKLAALDQFHQLSAVSRSDLFTYCVTIVGWFRGSVVERRSLIGELSLVCTGPAADG